MSSGILGSGSAWFWWCPPPASRQGSTCSDSLPGPSSLGDRCLLLAPLSPASTISEICCSAESFLHARLLGGYHTEVCFLWLQVRACCCSLSFGVSGKGSLIWAGGEASSGYPFYSAACAQCPSHGSKKALGVGKPLSSQSQSQSQRREREKPPKAEEPTQETPDLRFLLS